MLENPNSPVTRVERMDVETAARAVPPGATRLLAESFAVISWVTPPTVTLPTTVTVLEPDALMATLTSPFAGTLSFVSLDFTSSVAVDPFLRFRPT